jgi:antitoxin VapB
LCAEAIHSTVRAIRPGQTEHQIAGLLAREAESRGVRVVVNLIATDERIHHYRHPLPTAKKLERYAMVVLCGRRHGLICSTTRFVHFGQLPDELRCRAEAVAHVDATFISATRPGCSLGQIFHRAVAAYAQVGFPDEWRLHHQGGLAGYEPREVLATPDAPEVVSRGQVFAWNPSITGTKSEDTILVTENDHEVLTTIPGWPTLTVQVNGKTLERPTILEVT